MTQLTSLTAPPFPLFVSSLSTRSFSLLIFLAYCCATCTVLSVLPSLTTMISYVNLLPFALLSRCSMHSSNIGGTETGSVNFSKIKTFPRLTSFLLVVSGDNNAQIFGGRIIQRRKQVFTARHGIQKVPFSIANRHVRIRFCRHLDQDTYLKRDVFLNR